MPSDMPEFPDFSEPVSISRAVSDPSLWGGGETSASKWVYGYNGVYLSNPPYKYRVSLYTDVEWQLFGKFNSLGTASYVANVAILALHLEHKYELNPVEGKDAGELRRWRSIARNKAMEDVARERHPAIAAAIAEQKAKIVRVQAEKKAALEKERQAFMQEIRAKRAAFSVQEACREIYQRTGVLELAVAISEGSTEWLTALVANPASSDRIRTEAQYEIARRALRDELKVKIPPTRR